jgi:hypothetical protein
MNNKEGEVTETKYEARKSPTIVGDVGGDARVGTWPGCLTKSVYTAMRRVMAAKACSELEALAFLRTTGARSRQHYGIRTVRQK